LDPETYPALTTLYKGGPGALFERAEQEAAFVPDADGYVSHCDLCQAIRAHLAHQTPGRFPDLQPLEFYDRTMR
jgi:hypothetical protein